MREAQQEAFPDVAALIRATPCCGPKKGGLSAALSFVDARLKPGPDMTIIA
jgi:hypothetical protein